MIFVKRLTHDFCQKKRIIKFLFFDKINPEIEFGNVLVLEKGFFDYRHIGF